MAHKIRSQDVTEGPTKAGSRAMLRAVGLTDADFAAARREGISDRELAELVAWSGTIALLIATSRAFGHV